MGEWGEWGRMGRRAVRTAAATTVVALALGACRGDTQPQGDAAGIDPAVIEELAPADARMAATAVNGFGFDLHRALTDGTGDNVVTSPLSTATLLAMVAAGTAGPTAAELVEVLGLEGARDLRSAALLRDVSATDQVTIAVANSVWADDDVQLVEDYAAFVTDVFGARVATLDLAGPDVVESIDEWVAEHTADRIDGIAEDLGLPSDHAVVVLANAVYFLGEWSVPFDPGRTRHLPFRLPDGTTVDVATMTADGIEGAQTVARNGYAVLRLPYGADGRYAMEVFLPDEDSDLPRLLGQLDAREWAAATGALGPADRLPVQLPRFELEWGGSLVEPLRALGVQQVFDAGADLTPMIPTGAWIEEVVHKTYIRVDEQGTEAAAVTGGVGVTSAPATRFVVDRPFAFTVSDRASGAVLFLGTVTDPRD